MDKKILSGIMVLIAVISFITGGYASFYVRGNKQQAVVSQKQEQGDPKKCAVMETAVKNISSNVIDSSLAFGKVSKISGKNITLASGDESVVFSLTDSSKIYIIDTSTKSNKEVDLSQMKVGDYLSINFNVLPDGSMQIASAFISAK